jgi:hypothetical protein
MPHVVPTPVPLHAVRLPCGAPVTGAQVPFTAPSQASHCPLQALSQQTPSTQKNEAHSPAAPQVVPLAAATYCSVLDSDIVLLLSLAPPTINTDPSSKVVPMNVS